jgi:hypothetical protein
VAAACSSASSARLVFAAGVLLTPPAPKLDAQFSRGLVKAASLLVHIRGGKSLVQGAVLREPGLC